MTKLRLLALAILLVAAFSCSGLASDSQTFVGSIGDSMCGLKHMMSGDDKKCTEECVKGGGKYILADAEHNKVYQLDDQEKPKAFSGQKVKVTGVLKGETIEVASIEAAK